MLNASDKELMREFTENNSEVAFSELVSRYINLVYSVALRYMANGEDAQDVTQAVFIILAKKAVKLRERTTLTGWLYETTRLAAAGCLRARARRQTHEQEAAMESNLNESAPDPVWHQLAPHLEDAMSRLGAKDRALLALRFFENKTGAEAAALLGIREAAAYKRTTLALEKLRTFFIKRGIAVSAVAIASAVSANSVQAAPAALAKTVSAVAITKGAALSAQLSMLIKGTLKTMTWMKIKFAVGAGLAILLAGGAAALVESPKISEQSYSMRGRIVWSAGTNHWTTPVEVQRKGDTVKITETQPSGGSNYYASTFICTKTNAINLVQPSGALSALSKGFDGGYLSNHRQPLEAGAGLTWLMVQGGAEFQQSSKWGFRSQFSDYPRSFLHERPVVSPKISRSTFWTAGLSDYSEIYTNQEGVINELSFRIQTWTNVAGVRFPNSFTAIFNRTETDTNTTPLFPSSAKMSCEFVATEIQELPGEIDTRLPDRVRIVDWRPRENGVADHAVMYETTNGVVYSDALKAAKEQGTKFKLLEDFLEDFAGMSRNYHFGKDFEGKTLHAAPIKIPMNGKYVLVTFWSCDSAPCIRQMPELKETYEAFGKDDRLTMFSLTADEQTEKVKATVEQYQLKWPQLLLSGNERHMLMGFPGPFLRIPAVFLIGPDGKVVMRIENKIKESVEVYLKSQSKTN